MEGEYALPSSVEPDDRKRAYEGVVGEAPASIDGQAKRSRPGQCVALQPPVNILIAL